MPSNGIQMQFVAGDKLGVIYWKESFNGMRFFDLKSGKSLGDVQLPFEASITPMSRPGPDDTGMSIGL